jgi:maltose O-acetyltransferase
MSHGGAMIAVLPRPLNSYLRSPFETIRKLRDWLRAWFQLRSCDQVGSWTQVTGKVFVQNRGTIRIGERVRLHSKFGSSLLATYPGGLLEIGDRTWLNYGADICATGLVRIGSDCLIGTHVIILDNHFHALEDRRTVPEPRPVVIEDRVWIGNRVTILPGVAIGHDSVIGAGSVVTRDVPSRSVAVGNPARVVKHF